MTRLPDLPRRPADAHKGSCGRVIIVGGSRRYPGAPILAARAALRGGAGLVAVACPDTIAATLGARVESETLLPLPTGGDGRLDEHTVQSLLGLPAERIVLAVGPGLDAGLDAAVFARAIALRSRARLLLDADGLNAFAGRLDELKAAEGPRILTPHLGEAARLLETDTDQVRADLVAAGKALAARTGATVVLKSERTGIHDGEQVWCNRSGSPALATAGTGDVLTGLIAALWTQGLSAVDAAVLGTHLHGRAGELCAHRLGVHGTLAPDVIDALPEAFLRHAEERRPAD